MTVLDFTFVHSVSVKTWTAADSFGPTLDGAVTAVPCYVQDTVETVQDDEGRDAVSSAKLNAPLDYAPTVPVVAGQFTTGSEVTLPSGRVARVIKTARHDSGALALGLDHVQVWLK